MAGRGSRTPLFSFDTPARDRSSPRNVGNSTARDILRNIVGPGTPTTTTATEVTMLTVTSKITSTPVLMPSTTQTQFCSVVMPSLSSTSMNQGSC